MCGRGNSRRVYRLHILLLISFKLIYVNYFNSLELELSVWVLEYLLPSKARPATSAVAARRMVSQTLGLSTNVTKEQQIKERQVLKTAKGKLDPLFFIFLLTFNKFYE